MNRWIEVAAKRTDLVVIVLILAAILMMILPLPTFLVDILIAISITFSLLVLVVALYIAEPVQFSTLPSVILLGTLFRLSLSITTTRLILVQANAGDIVTAFGEFVVAGQVVVGLVVFLIITVAQFVVITKGSERVAEVAARFTLDALPGKQMSIDNEARNGDITQEQAKHKRQLLERESQFYGAMDGAMKFVKGDAIAGLIIIAVNLIGGLLIGVWQQGMAFEEAAHTYSLLTVGDGLIAQIPSLMVSVAAGAVVTRVASHGDQNLGSEVAQQLGSDPRVLALASGILLALSLVPGFPALIFIVLSCLIGGLAVLARNKQGGLMTNTEEVMPAERTGRIEMEGANARLKLCLADDRASLLPPSLFKEQTNSIRAQILDDLGVSIPPIGLRTEAGMEGAFRIEFDGVPIRHGELPETFVWVRSDPVNLDLLNMPYHHGISLIDGGQALMVSKEHASKLAEAGIRFSSAAAVLLETVDVCARQYASQFLGFQETRDLLSSVEAELGELVKEAISASSIQKMSEILRRLVEERVPITNLRAILEAVVEWAPHVASAQGLAEYARVSLARQICHLTSVENRVIAAYILTRQAEEVVRGSVQAGQYTPETVSRPIVDQIVAANRASDPDLKRVVLTSMDIRRSVRSLLVRHGVDLPVLSYQEIAPEFRVQALASISHQPGPHTQHFQPAEEAQSAA
ncbi:type III secretion system export apparatus subunit SctV [Ensifer sp. ENS02]|uniref:type III secretion system export apparatus subunit SctV n=1 Tax=Ensifer sp. ENS02 TaxID=2769290 RepID=UPI001FEE3352|nr:type III secretion system export apparatus subunit SctV [Ensifer sp. ENS02]